jgi:hypothetical protein
MAFYESSDWQYNCVSCFSGDMRKHFGTYAKGYRLAAVAVAERTLSSGHIPDYCGYPIIFLFRHAFELHLKNVIYGLATLAAFKRIGDIDIGLYNNHNLSALAGRATGLLNRLFPKDEGIVALTEQMSTTAEEFAQIDKDSFSYRYPIDVKGAPSTRVGQTVNLKAFAEHMDELLEKLEVLDFGMNVETDKAQEMYELLESIWPSRDEA